jgi:hypothetical protein
VLEVRVISLAKCRAENIPATSFRISSLPRDPLTMSKMFEHLTTGNTTGPHFQRALNAMKNGMFPSYLLPARNLFPSAFAPRKARAVPDAELRSSRQPGLRSGAPVCTFRALHNV